MNCTVIYCQPSALSALKLQRTKNALKKIQTGRGGRSPEKKHQNWYTPKCYVEIYITSASARVKPWGVEEISPICPLCSHLFFTSPLVVITFIMFSFFIAVVKIIAKSVTKPFETILQRWW